MRSSRPAGGLLAFPPGHMEKSLPVEPSGREDPSGEHAVERMRRRDGKRLPEATSGSDHVDEHAPAHGSTTEARKTTHPVSCAVAFGPWLLGQLARTNMRRDGKVRPSPVRKGAAYSSTWERTASRSFSGSVFMITASGPAIAVFSSQYRWKLG